MDNSESSELKREVLLKVLTGDDVRGAVLHALCNLGLIRKRADAPKRKGMDSWYANPTTDYELTAKGLRRLQGD
jgi:hypothetical protein